MFKKNLYLIMLEPLESRYTKQWLTHLPKKFSKYFDVKVIVGKPLPDKIDKGRFLDIYQTNIWKSDQINVLANLFQENKIKDGDSFLFMDGWHYGITALKYMAQLSNIKIKTYAYWHAGTWDEHDFITQAGLKDWAKYSEAGWFRACDGHFVATQFHKNLIEKQFGREIGRKIHVVGFPMDWKKEVSIVDKKLEKENIVAFPHRLDPEKQPEIFDKLKKDNPDCRFLKTIELTNNKEDYYSLLKKSKVSFSSSLQETFGIGTVEALFLDCIPLVPDRLSYTELYLDEFKYKTLDEAQVKLDQFIEYYPKFKKLIKENQKHIKKQSNDSIKLMSKVMKK